LSETDKVTERGEDCLQYDVGEFATVLDGALRTEFIETKLSEGILDGVGSEPTELFQLTVRCIFTSNRVHALSPVGVLPVLAIPTSE
jgi:hypothetical protein